MKRRSASLSIIFVSPNPPLRTEIMAYVLCKNLHLCLSKLRKSPRHPDPKPPAGTSHRKTHDSGESSDGFLFKNFNSLYTPTAGEEFKDDSESPPVFTSDSRSSDFTSDSESFSEIPVGLSNVLASSRFFFSPGRSNSIAEDARCSSSVVENPSECLTPLLEEEAVVNGGVVVPTYSPDPYVDFRQSMQEMVEAYDFDIRVDWDYLQELLLCYLSLNSEQTHKFIVGAFADLLMSLMTTSPASNIPGRWTDFR